MKDETLKKLEEYSEECREKAIVGEAADREFHERYMESLKTLREIEHDNMEYYDKQERREIDRKKNDDAKEIEDNKQKVGGPRMFLETAKIVVPIVTAIISAGVVMKMQDKSGKFEESGRWTSEASRMAHNQMPKIWK